MTAAAVDTGLKIETVIQSMRLLGAFARGAGFESLRHFGASPRYFRDTERARQIEEGGEEWHERGDDRGERGDTGEEGSARR